MGNDQPSSGALRRRAEDHLKHQPRHEDIAQTANHDQRVVQELRIHKIELEMQNEALINSRAEIEAERSRYLTLYDFAPVGYFDLDQHGTIIETNLAGARLLDSERSSLIGKRFGLFLSRQTLPAFNALLQRALAAKGKQSCMVEILRSDQPPLTVQLEVTSFPGAREWLVVAMDITELQQVKDNLESSNELNEILLQTIPFPLDIVDAQGKVLYLNPRMAQAIGQPVEGKTCWQLYKDDQQPCSACPLQRPIQVGKTAMVECAGVLGGKVFEIYHTGMIFRGREALMEIFIDASQRKEVEHLLLESKNRMQAILDQTPAVIYTTDLDGRFTFVNKPCADLFGQPFGNILGKYSHDFLPKEIADQQHLNDLEVLQRGQSKTFEEHTVEADGPHIYLANKFPLHDGTGNIIAVAGISTDISEQVRISKEQAQLRDQLAQLQKMETVGQLAGGVAHDFNNMLGVILSQAEMSLRSLPPDHPVVERLQEILLAAERSADLTRQLLTFARKQPIAPKVLDLNELVEGMFKMLRRLIGESIEISWFAGAGLWHVRMDPSQLEQLLINLIVNARDAITAAGAIIIETRNAVFAAEFCVAPVDVPPGDYVMLSVSDNGCGMDPATQACIFEPFFTTKEVGKGTGLGLATVYGIVKQNGGFINVSSTPGDGSTFKVYLPRCTEEVDPSRSDSQTEPLSSLNITVLLVEDEPAVMAAVEMLLEALGCRVLSADTPGKALELTENYGDQIDLLLTDVVMPKMSGQVLAERVQALRPNLKCLLMSGYSAEMSDHVEASGPCRHFIQKPFMLKDIEAKVRKILDI